MNAYLQLVRELKSLRKGRGVLAGSIGDRVGPTLRATCGVAEDDEPGTIRQKVTTRLAELAGHLPDDLRLATLAAFAIDLDAEAKLPLYQERVRWASVRMDRDPRTVRRRVDEAISHLAELATAVPRDRPANRSHGWRTAELHAVLTLDGPCPEVIERHRVVADRGGLRELVLTPHPLHRPGLDVRVIYGGTFAGSTALTLVLPSSVPAGEGHDFGIGFRPAGGHPAPTCLAYAPRHPCDLLDVRVRFGRTPTPPRVWALHGVHEPDRQGDRHPVDRAGEIHLRFRHLTPGLAYGARWELPDRSPDTGPDRPPR